MDHRKPGFLKRHARLMGAVSGTAILVVGLGAFALVPQLTAVRTTTGVQVAANEARPAAPRLLENGAPMSFADLVEHVSPAVVTVTVQTAAQQNAASDIDPKDIPAPFRDFFRQFGQQGQGGQQAPQRRGMAQGSGFIIDKAGYIVTNNHVIDNSSKITVKLTDGRTFDAKLVGTDAATDIALLKIMAGRDLPVVEFGDDRRLRVGDWVVAVGNPFGLQNSVTAGIVSSLGRDLGNQIYTDFIQIDAPINSGNSGGPTFDLHGQVVGMNSMIFSPSGGSVGIGFAIPSSIIHDVVAQLKSSGRVARGMLGVQIQSVTPEIATSLGLANQKGALVASVVPGGPAEKAGFQQGDIVVAINGKEVEDNRDMTRRVAAIPAGSKATFSVNRQGAKRDITATIVPREEQVASNAPTSRNASAPAATAQALGLGLSSLTPESRRAFSLGDNVSGVVITRVDPNSDAADKGIQAGDVVVSVGNQQVRTPQDVQTHVAAARKGGRTTILLLISGQAGTRYVAVDAGQA